MSSSNVTQTKPVKATGDISSVFPSLSGRKVEALPERFSELKKERIQGHEIAVKESWDRLLGDLSEEIKVIKAKGSEVCFIELCQTTND